MKRKGFTLIELLIVIAIIALLMGILMPALARARLLAYQLVCGTNLRGISSSLVAYANENEDEYPRAGHRDAIWSTSGYITDWEKGVFTNGATITSSFFLLVKYTKVTPKQFVCRGDDGARAFQLGDMSGVMAFDSMSDFWDFGNIGNNENGRRPGEYCSYSCHMPYNNGPQPGFPLNEGTNAAAPVCADRNPYLDKNAPTTPPTAQDDIDNFNSSAHQEKGQNVLYKDSSVRFEPRPIVGIGDNNIWLYGDEPAIGTPGTGPTANGDGAPMATDDAYLVGEQNY